MKRRLMLALPLSLPLVMLAEKHENLDDQVLEMADLWATKFVTGTPEERQAVTLALLDVVNRRRKAMKRRDD